MSASDAPPISRSSLSLGELEKSGPEAVMGASAIAQAIRMPPQAMNGIAYETPVKQFRPKFLNHLKNQVRRLQRNFSHCRQKPDSSAHQEHRHPKGST